MKKIIFIVAMLAAFTVRAQEPTLPITIQNQEMAWAMDWCSDHQFSETQYADFPSQHRRERCDMVPYAATGMLDVTWGKDGYDIRRLYGAVHRLHGEVKSIHRKQAPSSGTTTVPYTNPSPPTSIQNEDALYFGKCDGTQPEREFLCGSFNGGPVLPIRLDKVYDLEALDQRITALEKRVAELEQREHVRNSPTRGRIEWLYCQVIAVLGSGLYFLWIASSESHEGY